MISTKPTPKPTPSKAAQFSRNAAKLLQPGQHLTVADNPGLRLVASASKRTWIYRYKDNQGRMKQVALGQWPAMDLAAAGGRLAEARKAHREGNSPRQLRNPQTPGQEAAYTVESVVRDHIKVVQQSRKASGALAVKRALERVLAVEPWFAERPAASITRADAYKILDDRKGKPTAAAKIRSLLGTAWDEAIDAGRIGEPTNWWRLVMRGKLKSKGKIMGGKHVGRKRPHLTPEQVGTLLVWSRLNLPQVAADMLTLYLYTGTRGSEIAGMRPEHVQKERTGWWWTIPKASTKNADVDLAVDLRVPLVGTALEVVQRRVMRTGKSGWVFSADADGEPYTQHRFSTYIYDLQPYSAKVKRRQGDGLVLTVTGWTPHHLRRTARTMLASLGCSDEVGEAIIGHLPKDIVGVYNAYTYDQERMHWLGALGRHLDQLASSASS